MKEIKVPMSHYIENIFVPFLFQHIIYNVYYFARNNCMASASASCTESEPERSWIFLTFRGATLSCGMLLLSKSFRFRGLKNNIQISIQMVYTSTQLIKIPLAASPVIFLVHISFFS